MDKYNKEQHQRRLKLLRDMFEPKPYTSEWAGMARLVSVISFIIQVGTAACAVSFLAYGGFKMFGSWPLGITVGVITVGVFEIAKRMMSNKTAKYHYQGRMAHGMKAVLGAFIGASISMSYFGTPLVVQQFAPMPESATRSEVVAHLDTLEQKAIAPWLAMQETAKQKAKDIHKQNNWKGVTTRKARPAQLAFEQQIAKAQDSVASIKAAYASKKSALWESSQRSHSEILRAHEDEMGLIGGIFAGICLLLEVLFLVCVFWLTDYKFHMYCEATEGTTKRPTKLTKSTKPEVQRVPTNTAIGFRSEGKVEMIDGKAHVWCMKANGELKAYSASQLSSNIRNTKGERKEYFETMKRRLK